MSYETTEHMSVLMNYQRLLKLFSAEAIRISNILTASVV